MTVRRVSPRPRAGGTGAKAVTGAGVAGTAPGAAETARPGGRAPAGEKSHPPPDMLVMRLPCSSSRSHLCVAQADRRVVRGHLDCAFLVDFVSESVEVRIFAVLLEPWRRVEGSPHLVRRADCEHRIRR